jgi:hypothetical protein
MSESPFFHEPTGTVRFWVEVEGQLIGASIPKEILHRVYRPGVHDDVPLDTYKAHSVAIDAAVQRRVAKVSIEPVMLREFDLKEVPV